MAGQFEMKARAQLDIAGLAVAGCGVNPNTFNAVLGEIPAHARVLVTTGIIIQSVIALQAVIFLRALIAPLIGRRIFKGIIVHLIAR